ncbi:MAG: hypothetical protein F4Y11_11100 [Chloroflexi bacterium]|nr:hypothetical protein [Chloroflexota bacterium]
MAKAFRASSAAFSNCSLRAMCSRMRGAASSISRSVFSITRQIRSSFWRISRSSASIVSNRSRSSRAAPSISSSNILTSSRMLLSVSTWSRSWSRISVSNRLALSLGVSQLPEPRLSREPQT